MAFYDKNFASKKSINPILLYSKWNRRARKTFGKTFNWMNFIEVLLFGMWNISPDLVRSGKFGPVQWGNPVRLSPAAKKCSGKVFDYDKKYTKKKLYFCIPLKKTKNKISWKQIRGLVGLEFVKTCDELVIGSCQLCQQWPSFIQLWSSICHPK